VTEEAGIGRLFQKSWRYPGQPLGRQPIPPGGIGKIARARDERRFLWKRGGSIGPPPPAGWARRAGRETAGSYTSDAAVLACVEKVPQPLDVVPRKVIDQLLGEGARYGVLGLQHGGDDIANLACDHDELLAMLSAMGDATSITPVGFRAASGMRASSTPGASLKRPAVF
jgi:hypothetical protein